MQNALWQGVSACASQRYTSFPLQIAREAGMAQYFFESRDDFHYDNSGYYGYIVFNGDEGTLNGLRNALGQGRQSHGLGWYRYGKSFRPANDGRMYDWYIRLHSGGNDKPAAKDVDAFLRRHLKPPLPVPRQNVPTQPEENHLRLQEVLERLERIDARIPENYGQPRQDSFVVREEILKKLRVIEAGVDDLQEVTGSVNEVRVEAARLQDRLEEAKGELEEKDRQIDELNKQLSTTDRSAEIQEFNTRVRRLNSKINYQEGLIDKYKKDLQKSRSDNNTLEEKLKDANSKKDEWEDKYHRLNSEASFDPAAESDEESFETTVVNLAPQMHLIRGTTDIVRHEFQHTKPVLDLLRQIVLIKGFNGRNKIVNTKWRESHVGNTDWRMYFCKEERLMKGRIVAFLSDKNSQDDDIRWMQTHSPDSCI
ncbi:MAG: hypothetical protein OXB89_01075 [Anaerolineaceae bacterium]|nr:hypothetical protein [Anaerolineaceae bacterium]